MLFINKEELIQLIKIHQAYAVKYLEAGDHTRSFYAGKIESYKLLLLALDNLETIEGPKRERKVKR